MIGVGTFTVTPRMRELVNGVLDTGRISYGPLSQALESRFAALHDREYGVLSNSGTSSLQVALQALKELDDWADGDEVIIPAVTFVATANIVLHNRLKPVLVDVDPDYYEMAPEQVEAAVSPRTRALLPVHLFGQPCDMTALMDIARRYDLRVIEDSCETMFVGHAGKPTGSFGDVACFSTYVAHLLTTGVGGLALTDDPDLAAVMRSLVNHGRDGIYISIDDDGEGVSGQRRREIIARRFNFERIGHSFRVTELEAALGLAQLDTWREMIAKRQANAAYLTAHLSHLGAHLQLPAIRQGTGHAFMMYPVVCRHEGKRGLVEHLEARGIETRDMLPLVNQPCYTGLWEPADYPVAEWIDASGFYIPSHQDLTRADLDAIVGAFEDYYGRR